MVRPFSHFAELTAGSVAEAIMNTVGGGQDGHFFNVPQGEVCRVRIASLESDHPGGAGRFRIRQDQDVPAAATPPVLGAADPIFGFFAVPLGAAGVEDVGSQPFELPGTITPVAAGGAGGAAGTNYYCTIQQPGGAAFAAVLLQGTIG